MPTMAEYAASGGYANDAAVSRNLNNGGSVSSGGSSKKKTPAPQIPTMMDATAYAKLPSSVAAEQAGLAYQNTMTPPVAGGYMNVPTYGGTPSPTMPTPQPGVQQPFNMPTVPKVPMPPVRDMNAITQYAEGQVKSKLDAATSARDLATNNLQTQAQQLQQQLNDQRTAQANRLAATRDQALKGLQTGYTQAQGALTDQRNLQNVAFQRNNDPYSGATDYKNAMLGREREITDRNNNQLYTNQIGSLEQDYSNNTAQLDQDISSRTAKIQQDLQMNQANVQKAWQDVANAAPAEKERLIKEAQDSERSYALALQNSQRDDVLTQLQAAKTQMENTRLNQDVLNSNRTYDLEKNRFGETQYQFDQTMGETKKQNSNQNAISVGTLTGNYTNPQVQSAIQQILQLKQAAESNPDNVAVYKQKADQLRNQLAMMGVDPSVVGFDSDYNTAAKNVSGINFSQRTLAGQNQDTVKQSQKQSEALARTQTMGVVSQQDAAILGVPAGTTTAQLQGVLASKNYQDANLKLDEKWKNYEMDPNNPANQLRQKQVDELGKPKQMQDDEVAKMIESSPLLQKQYDEDGKATGTTVPEGNKQQLAQYIASLGLPPEQAKKWFIRYGLWSGK